MSKKMLISPKYKLTAKFADGSEVFGRARQIILGGPGCKIESLTWQGIPVPLDALQALDDGLFVCVNDVPNYQPDPRQKGSSMLKVPATYNEDGEIGNLREQVRVLREAAQRVIDNWDGGDLADSVRELSLILEATKEA